MRIIGITGTVGAGKGTVVEYLVKRYGFAHYSVRDFIAEEVKRRGLSITRDALIDVGNDIRKINSAGYIAEQLYNRAVVAGHDAAIESLRTIGEVESLRKKEKFVLLAVDADPRVRYERISARGGETDTVSLEKFLADEKREMFSGDPTKQNISSCMKLADFTLMNNGTLNELYEQIDSVIAKVGAL